MPFTTYGKNWLLSVLAGETLYVALFTVSPGTEGGCTEVSGGSYARKEITFKSPVDGRIGCEYMTFNRATADWGTIVATGIYDAPTGGNLLTYADLDVSVTVSETEMVEIIEDGITLSFEDCTE